MKKSAFVLFALLMVCGILAPAYADESYTLQAPAFAPVPQPQFVGPEMGAGPVGTPPAGFALILQPQAITVDDTSVYVVNGNQLLKFDKLTMKLLASADLPPL